MVKGGKGLFWMVLLTGLGFLFSGCAQIEELGHQVDLLQTDISGLQAQVAEQEGQLEEKEGQILRLTEKGKELEARNAEYRQELESKSVAYREALESKEIEYQGILDAQSAEHRQALADLQGQFASCQEKLTAETIRGKGIKIIFFNGDILYEVSSSGYVDFRAGLRYRSLGDSFFFEKLELFEEGKGGDFEVLAVLKEMDLSRDRVIDDREAKAFRKREEVNFSRLDVVGKQESGSGQM